MTPRYDAFEMLLAVVVFSIVAFIVGAVLGGEK